MDATVKRKPRQAKGARVPSLRPIEPVHESDGAHLELRIWLRLLSCSTRIEKALNGRLRKEFNTTLARFDLLAQLARRPAGATMSEVSDLLEASPDLMSARTGLGETPLHYLAVEGHARELAEALRQRKIEAVALLEHHQLKLPGF